MENESSTKSFKEIAINKITGSMSRQVFYLYAIVLFYPTFYVLRYGLNSLFNFKRNIGISGDWITLALLIGLFIYLNKIVPIKTKK